VTERAYAYHGSCGPNCDVPPASAAGAVRSAAAATATTLFRNMWVVRVIGLLLVA
jgi:hypothetical protein